MTTPGTSAQSNPATLLACLQAQAERRGGHIAVRQKLRGIWHQTTWQLLVAQVEQAAGALAARGFEAGDHVAIATAPRSEAFIVALAALWLGGVPLLVELPEQSEAHADEVRVDEAAAPAVRFAFVEEAGTAARLEYALRLKERFLAVIYAGSAAPAETTTSHVSYSAFSGEQYPELAPRALSAGPVWVLVQTSGSGRHGLSVQSFPEAALLEHARSAIEAEKLTPDRDAFTLPGLPSAAIVHTLLAPWLVEGFRLNFPEQESSADPDRRELGPELVLATPDGYTSLHRRVTENLPRTGTWSRSVLDWALRTRPGTIGHLLGTWLVRRPLRDVIGFSNVTSALVVGDAPLDSTLELFAKLGVTVRPWPRSPLAGVFEASSEVSGAAALLELEPSLQSEASFVGGTL